MTRRKWIKLRRQRPELFGMLPSFEKWSPSEHDTMRTVSRGEAIAVMTAWKLRGNRGQTVAGMGWKLLTIPMPFDAKALGGKWNFVRMPPAYDPAILTDP